MSKGRKVDLARRSLIDWMILLAAEFDKPVPDLLRGESHLAQKKARFAL